MIHKRWLDSTPLCPAGHLPSRGEISGFDPDASLAALAIWREVDES
jgi:hypothetical protein